MLENVIPSPFAGQQLLNTLAFGGSPEDPRDYQPFQEHCKQLYSNQDSTAYAHKLWKAMVKGKTRGVTADVFFLVLLKLNLDQEKTRLELFYLLEKYTILQKIALGLVFGLEMYLCNVQVKSTDAILSPTDDNASLDNRKRAVDKGLTLLRSKFKDRTHPCALDFFLRCPKTSGYLSDNILREAALQDYRIAQIIFADKTLCKKLLKIFLTQDDLITLVANTPQLDSKLANDLVELLFGIPLNNDYFITLFEIVFAHPRHLSTLLDSQLLAKAAQQENIENVQHQRAIKNIREYFYAGYFNPRLAIYLKQHPEVFIQLAGTEGQRIVDLLRLTEKPLELLKFFAPFQLFQDKFQQHIGDIALSIIEKYPKYTDQLLKIKVGAKSIREHLRDELLNNDLSSEQATAQFRERFQFRHKLKLSIADYKKLLDKPLPEIELTVVLDEKLRKKFERTYDTSNRLFFAARHLVARLSTTGHKPECLSVASSIILVSTYSKWKKISSPHWFEKKKDFEKRQRDLMTNPVFKARMQLNVNKKNITWQQIMAQLIKNCRQEPDFFEYDYSDTLKNLVCHFTRITDLWKLTDKHQKLKNYAQQNYRDKFIDSLFVKLASSVNKKSPEYMQTLRDLVAQNNAAITLTLFSGKFDLNLENFDNVRQLSKENLLFWENVVANDELREKIAPETWVRIIAHNPAAQRGVLKKSPSGFINTLRTVFKAKTGYEFLFATTWATMFTSPKTPDKPKDTATATSSLQQSTVARELSFAT